MGPDWALQLALRLGVLWVATDDGNIQVSQDDNRTWTEVSRNLDGDGEGCWVSRVEASYVNVVSQDPRNRNVLYAGTEFGFYVSMEEGGSLKRFMTGLPTVRVDDLVVHPRDGDLVLGTHGRGALIMDDITPLQQLTGDVLASDEHLFQPRNAVRWRVDTRLARGATGVKP